MTAKKSKFTYMKKIFIALFLFIGLLQVSCSPETVSNSPTTNPVDVYVAGSKDGQACYWKNGQVVMLDSGSFSNLDTMKIIVSNNNVYVLGYGYNSNTRGSMLLWKNGALSNLSNELSTDDYSISITDMEIIGNDIYFSGYTYKKPFDINVPSNLVYWKNNNKIVVETFDSYVFSESRIKIVDNNIYIISSRDGGTGIDGYYINGVFSELPVNTYLSTKLVVNGNDVFIYGTTNSISFIKNIVNNIMITNANSIGSLLTFDNDGDRYYTVNNKIYKNDNVILENNTNSCLRFYELMVVNNNLFMLNLCDNDIDPRANTLDVNGVTTMTTINGEIFNSIFIVQN